MRKTVQGVGVCILLSVFSVAAAGECPRFPDTASSAFDAIAGKITLPWRTDLPADPGTKSYAWQGNDFAADWKAYLFSVLNEAKASGIVIRNGRIAMNAQADWWIAPWMDFGKSGRERINGLTAERGPDAGDLSPISTKGPETWAVGWYNRPGAFGIKQVYSDPCNPVVPTGWHFPDQSASFKLLFSTADVNEVAYLQGAPEVEADTKRNGVASGATKLRLIQVDVAIRDPRAPATNWVMGTFVWKGPPKGDGFFDNLVPVGLMWGNDEGVTDDDWAAFAQIKESKINPDLAGVLWQGNGVVWLQRPYPGFQGRLNGPADNLRSSCLSCHAMAQWRRGPLGLTPTYKLQPKPSATQVRKLVEEYFKNTMGGSLVDSAHAPGTSLDYSLQLEAGMLHMCDACSQEKLAGATPQVCKVPGGQGAITVDRPTCEKNVGQKIMELFAPAESEIGMLPRQ